MKSSASVDEKEFETAELFIFGGLSLIMAILKLVKEFASRQAFEERR